MTRLTILASLLCSCLSQPEDAVRTQFPLPTDHWEGQNVTGTRQVPGVVTRVTLEGDRLFPCEPAHVESVGTNYGVGEVVTATITAKRCDVGAEPVTLVLWVKREGL